MIKIQVLEKTLVERLTEYLVEPRHIQMIYGDFPEEKRHSIRARLSENVNKVFKRLDKGVYVATNGDSTGVIIEGDAWEISKNFETGSVDHIITDFPHETTDLAASIGTTRKKEGKLTYDTKNIDKEIIKEMFRMLKDGGHCYLFLPADSSSECMYKGEKISKHHFNDTVIGMMEEEGFVFNKRMIWDKMTIGMGYNARDRHEQIIFFSKGKRRMPVDRSIADVLTHKRVSHQKRMHENEKPVELYEDLIKLCSNEGEVLVDLCAGSLPLLRACLKLKRFAICIELSKEIIATVFSSERFREEMKALGVCVYRGGGNE